MNTETTTCIHCNQHTANIERYNLAGREIETRTCRNIKCDMWGVTLSPCEHEIVTHDPAKQAQWAATVAKMRAYQGGGY